jgi:hypothetical protein
MFLVDEIRRKYPNPVRSGGQPDDTYCVGGAFCLSREGRVAWNNFPISPYLAQELRLENPTLSDYDALEIANSIIDANDNERFEEAWAWLEKGLTPHE